MKKRYIVLIVLSIVLFTLFNQVICGVQEGIPKKWFMNKDTGQCINERRCSVSLVAYRQVDVSECDCNNLEIEEFLGKRTIDGVEVPYTEEEIREFTQRGREVLFNKCETSKYFSQFR